MIQEPNLSAPIPGQSLTGEPKGYAWERPPEYNTPEEALEFYLPKKTDEETTDDILLALENDFPLSILVKGIYMNGVMEGLHSIDVGLLIAPVLHEVILSIAKTHNVDFDETPISESERLEGKEKDRLATAVERFLEKVEDRDEGTELIMSAAEAVQEEQPPQQDVEMEQPPEAEPQRGLMARSE